ncbi:MAG: YeeE/YedE family protein [Nitrosomonas sp.]|nr:YeeE/YedE family protein [Nitrosomonas sp.]MDP1951652.1 YeeE/YedE family protein [Nitrosomonas sp.]
MLFNFDYIPFPALAGGMLVGVAVALLILLNGRIAGISGIVGGLFRLQASDIGWRIAFVSGLVVSPLVWQQFFGLPHIRIDANYAMLIIAGLIVGFGARYGSGCTSGHAVCGVSRLSLRSIVATLVFMLTGFVTVYLIRHVFAA